MIKELTGLKQYCEQGLIAHEFNDLTTKNRYTKEIDAIKKYGYEAHFYYLACMIREVRKQGGYVFFRDYAEASLVNYLAGVSTTNPIEYGLDYRNLLGFEGDKEPCFYINIDDEGTAVAIETIRSLLPADRVIVHDSKEVMQMVILPEGYKELQAEKLRKKLAGKVGAGKALQLLYEYEMVEPNFILFTFFHNKDANMLAALQKVTGVLAESIDVNDKRLISMYTSTSALGFKDTGVWNIKNGMGGILDRSRAFDYIITKTNPENIEEVLVSYCLANGMDVWPYNAEVLLEKGYNLEKVLSYRESVYNYLISRDIDEKTAFDTTDFIRLGRASRPGTKDRWLSIKLEIAEKVEPWFIESVEKIKYMLSKPHALTYCLTDMRLAWYKLHYPNEFCEIYLKVNDCDFIHSEEFDENIVSLEDINRWFYRHVDWDDKFKEKLPIMQVIYEKLMREKARE